MSQVKVQGNASGTGVFTLAAPSGNTDRTLTLPDSAGTIATSESVAASGYATAASTLTQFNASGSAPVYACRAWVNFNGTVPAANMIRASGNVSSITDNGAGDYTVNFSTAMSDANYSASGGANGDATTLVVVTPITFAAGSTRIQIRQAGNALADYSVVSVSIFR